MSRGNGRPSPTPAEELNPSYATTFEPCAFCFRSVERSAPLLWRCVIARRCRGSSSRALPAHLLALHLKPHVTNVLKVNIFSVNMSFNISLSTNTNIISFSPCLNHRGRWVLSDGS